MAAFDFDYDESAPAPGGNFDPLPTGKYVAEITESSREEHQKAGKQKNGRDGRRVLLTLRILDGEFEGRLVWDRLDIDRESVNSKTGETLRIDHNRFNALVGVCGIGRLEDTTQLHSIPVFVSVKLDPAEGQYAAKNRITAYHAAVQDQAPVQRQPAPATRPATPAQTGKPGMPWKKAG